MSRVSPLRDHIRTAPVDSWLTVGVLAERYGSRDAVAATLRRARDAGEIVAVHRGVYWKGQQTRFGMTRPDTLTIGLAVARYAGFASGVGPASWTASNMLGLSTQIPRNCHLAVPGRAPAAPEHVQFHSRFAAGREGLDVIEVAVLEVLLTWPYEIEADWPDVVSLVRRLADAGNIEPWRLARAIELEPSAAVRDRGALLAATLDASCP